MPSLGLPFRAGSGEHSRRLCFWELPGTFSTQDSLGHLVSTIYLGSSSAHTRFLPPPPPTPGSVNEGLKWRICPLSLPKSAVGCQFILVEM